MNAREFGEPSDSVSLRIWGDCFDKMGFDWPFADWSCDFISTGVVIRSYKDSQLLLANKKIGFTLERVEDQVEAKLKWLVCGLMAALCGLILKRETTFNSRRVSWTGIRGSSCYQQPAVAHVSKAWKQTNGSRKVDVSPSVTPDITSFSTPDPSA
jgi:hypothetical protein